MIQKLHKLNLHPADRIVVPKSDLRWVQHHAIYLGWDANGVEWIAENKIGRGVQIVTLNNFLADSIEITRVERFNGTTWERDNAIRQAFALKGVQYDLLLFNCEHYANVVQFNKGESPQVHKGLALSFVTLLFLLFIVD